MRFVLKNNVWDSGCRECCQDCSVGCGEGCPSKKEYDGNCNRCIFKDGFTRDEFINIKE